jgi:hypothetical protein
MGFVVLILFPVVMPEERTFSMPAFSYSLLVPARQTLMQSM